MRITKMMKFAQVATAVAVAAALLVLLGASGSASAQMEEGQDNGYVQINVMKHICDESIQSIEDFESVDGPDAGGTTEFHDKVLACPTVIMPGDEYMDGAVHFDGKHRFDFSVMDASGTVQTISDAIFSQQQVCEADIQVDVNGDGQLTACLDTSLYVFEGVANGLVDVEETSPPSGTLPGALEFTPAAISPNNDADALLESENTVFEGGDRIINLDTTHDDDGVITLHVYNFVDDVEEHQGDDEMRDLTDLSELRTLLEEIRSLIRQIQSDLQERVL